MKAEELTGSIIGSEYRTAQEVFDVMADRIRGSDLTTRAETAERKLAEAMEEAAHVVEQLPNMLNISAAHVKATSPADCAAAIRALSKDGAL